MKKSSKRWTGRRRGGNYPVKHYGGSRCHPVLLNAALFSDISGEEMQKNDIKNALNFAKLRDWHLTVSNKTKQKKKKNRNWLMITPS